MTNKKHNKTGIRIRQARKTDAQRIAELSGELGYPADPKHMEKRLRSIADKTDHIVLVAEMENGEVVCWIHGCITSYLVAEPFVELGGLIVASFLQGQGIGKQLLSAVEQWARDKGINTVRARSRTTRKAAHVFYRDMGYQYVKTQETFVKKVGKE